MNTYPFTNVVTSEVLTMRDAGVVLRSHTCRALHHRNVAEHSHGVAMLIVLLGRASVPEPAPSSELLSAALCHDLSELATGDVPAPVKRDNPELKRVLNSISTKWELDHDIRFVLNDDEKELLLWCDRMDFALYALEEVTMGNAFFVTYLNRILDWLGELPAPAMYSAACLDLFLGVTSTAEHVLGRNHKQMRT